jgi:hypothetical protein
VRKLCPGTVIRLGAAVAIALMVAACGVRPSTLAPPAGADPAEVRDPMAPKAPPRDGEKPDKPFILDGLLM